MSQLRTPFDRPHRNHHTHTHICSQWSLGYRVLLVWSISWQKIYCRNLIFSFTTSKRTCAELFSIASSVQFYNVRILFQMYGPIHINRVRKCNNRVKHSVQINGSLKTIVYVWDRTVWVLTFENWIVGRRKKLVYVGWCEVVYVWFTFCEVCFYEQ